MRKRRHTARPPETKRYYDLHDGILSTLAEQGDAAAWEAWFHRRLVHRMATEPDCPECQDECGLGEDLWLSFQKKRGRVQMSLKIRRTTSLDAIKRHWDEIQTWRELLLEWQGPGYHEGAEGLSRELHGLYTYVRRSPLRYLDDLVHARKR